MFIPPESLLPAWRMGHPWTVITAKFMVVGSYFA
jgi:hypothetical protein